MKHRTQCNKAEYKPNKRRFVMDKIRDERALIEGQLRDHNIKEVVYDSRKVRPGAAFFAIRGQQVDGNDYITLARNAGASLIYSSDPEQIGRVQSRQGQKGQDQRGHGQISQVQSAQDVVIVEDVRLALALAAGIKYPDLPDKVVAVTGTNGKSSVVSYCRQIAEMLGIEAASIGTIGVEASARVLDLMRKERGDLNSDGLTMSDPITFRRNLHQLTKAGVQFVAYEASSHGIVQRRMGDVAAQAAAFTSFSQDHLDYHRNMDEYLAAKLQLFIHNLAPGGRVIVAGDIERKDEIVSFLEKNDVVTQLIATSKLPGTSNVSGVSNASRMCNAPGVGNVPGVRGVSGMSNAPGMSKMPEKILGEDNIEITIMRENVGGQDISCTIAGKEYAFRTSIVGSYQASNLLMAASLVAACGLSSYDAIMAVIHKVQAVTGRLQRIEIDREKEKDANAEEVDKRDSYHVFVDYAHTPDSLEKSLCELAKLLENGVDDREGERSVKHDIGQDIRQEVTQDIGRDISQEMARDIGQDIRQEMAQEMIQEIEQDVGRGVGRDREVSEKQKRRGKLLVLFGCGGDRDRSKRPLMGKIAAAIADRVIVTDDNPRTEDAAKIRAEIIAGIEEYLQSKGRKEKGNMAISEINITEIGDRKLAIQKAIEFLQKGDILLIAGKGHEDYQIIGASKYAFSDIALAKYFLDKKTSMI